MGMAASQARYLGLTARKTNVEYEGQQINQARTALANQSANTFNDLMKLEVPTAPSTQDFTTVQYSYTDGTNTETITRMELLANDPDGYNYMVTHYHYSDVYTGIENRLNNPQVYVTDKILEEKYDSNKIKEEIDPITGEKKYTVGGNPLSVYDENIQAQKDAFDKLSLAYPELKGLDPLNLLTYTDNNGVVHFSMKDEVEKVTAGTGDARDYYLKNNTTPTKDTVASNKVSSEIDPVTGEKKYKVNGKEASKYDETNAEIKAAYDKILQERPDIGEIDPDKLVYYKDAKGGVHFASTEELDKAIDGTDKFTDFSLTAGVPKTVGNIEISEYNPNDKDQLAAYEQIIKDWPDSNFAKPDANIYTWVKDNKRYFACESDLMASWNSAPDPTHPTENQAKLTNYTAQDVKTKIQVTEKAMVDFDESGRAQTIKYEDSSVVRTLKSETYTDEAAYKDAMNKYNYLQNVYEKNVADINAKTKKIQEQDRTLELRLRQLDTEQEALQTEMEAVKKVIDKNIESTFKTFE